MPSAILPWLLSSAFPTPSPPSAPSIAPTVTVDGADHPRPPPSLLSLFFRPVDIEKYLGWVYVSPSSARPRLFSSALLERLSSTPPIVVALLWLPVAIALLVAAARALPVWATPLLFAGGWAYWVLLEYLIHRFVFHADAALPGVAGAMLFHFIFHG